MAVHQIVNSAGTAYTLTSSSAAVTFGTKSPFITLTKHHGNRRLIRASRSQPGRRDIRSEPDNYH